MPVPPPEPFVPFRYQVDGTPGLIGAAHGSWVRAAAHLYQLASDLVSSASAVRFIGPEADAWRQKVAANADALNEAARGIQIAGEALGEWSEALDGAQKRMAPVEAAAQVAHTNILRTFSRVNAAESVLAAAEAALAAAESELAAATAATAATVGAAGGAVAAAAAHVTQATAEFTRASTEVSAAHAEHAAWTARWQAANTEADSIQEELSGEATRNSTTVRRGTAQESHVQESVARARTDSRPEDATAQVRSAASQVQGTVSQASSLVNNMTNGQGEGGDADDDQDVTQPSADSAESDQPSSGSSSGSENQSAGDAQNDGGGMAVGAPGMAAGAAGGKKSNSDDKKKGDKLGAPEPVEESTDDDSVDADADDNELEDMSLEELGRLLAQELAGTIGNR